jgi:hypothetical protein
MVFLPVSGKVARRPGCIKREYGSPAAVLRHGRLAALKHCAADGHEEQREQAFSPERPLLAA